MVLHHFTTDPRYRCHMDRAHRLRCRALAIVLRRVARATTQAGLRAVHLSGGFIRRMAEEYVQRRRQRAAIAELRRLSDRTLKDIGLHRSQICSVVTESGRGEGRSRALKPAEYALAENALAENEPDRPTAVAGAGLDGPALRLVSCLGREPVRSSVRVIAAVPRPDSGSSPLSGQRGCFGAKRPPGNTGRLSAHLERSQIRYCCGPLNTSVAFLRLADRGPAIVLRRELPP